MDNIQETFDTISAQMEALSDRDNELRAETAAALFAIGCLVFQLHKSGKLDAKVYVEALRHPRSVTPPVAELRKLADHIQTLLDERPDDGV